MGKTAAASEQSQAEEQGDQQQGHRQEELIRAKQQLPTGALAQCLLEDKSSATNH